MNYAVRFEDRDRITTVSLPSQRTLASAETAAQRLRSWAMILNVPIAGAPILVLEGGRNARVHMPISGTFMPHPETGICRDELPAARVVVVPDVRFGELEEVERALVAAFDAGSSSEYHTLDRDFYTGELRLALRREPRERPQTIHAGAGSQEREPVASGVRAITIASLPGSGGEAVAESLAHRLGFHVVDEDALVARATSAAVTSAELRQSMKPRSFFQRILDHMATVSPMAELPLTSATHHGSAFASRDECRRLLDREALSAARAGDAVIVTPAAGFALADRGDVMRVLVTASDESRARRLADAGAGPAALRTVQSADRELASVIEEHYQVAWLDASHYDLVINIERFDLAAAADFIASLAVQRMPTRAGGSLVPALPVAAAAANRASQPGNALPAPAAW